MIIGDTEGLVKIIAETNAEGHGGRILGVHMVGPWVTNNSDRVTWPSTGRPRLMKSRRSYNRIRQSVRPSVRPFLRSPVAAFTNPSRER